MEDSPNISRLTSPDGNGYLFKGIDELFAWAKAHDRLYRDALYWAKTMNCNEVETLRLILIAYIKDSERRTKESVSMFISPSSPSTAHLTFPHPNQKPITTPIPE